MKVSSQEEYGLRCLITIARCEAGHSLTIPDISRLQGLSQPHVAKLLAILRKSGWIKSSRGQAGGYTLALPPEKIIIGEVLSELGGKLYGSNFCSKHAGLEDICLHAHQNCALMNLWENIQSAVDRIVYSINLKDLLEGSAGKSMLNFSKCSSQIIRLP